MQDMSTEDIYYVFCRVYIVGICFGQAHKLYVKEYIGVVYVTAKNTR